MTLVAVPYTWDSGAVNVLLNPRQWNLRDFKRTYTKGLKPYMNSGATAVEQTGRNDDQLKGQKVSGAA